MVETIAQNDMRQSEAEEQARRHNAADLWDQLWKKEGGNAQRVRSEE